MSENIKDDVNETLLDKIRDLSDQALSLAEQIAKFAEDPFIHGIAPDMTSQPPSFLALFTVFILACFIGYYVIWSVTPALHSPLMGVTNAISSVIIVGALIAAGPVDVSLAKFFGFIAVVLASVNIFGGFVVTHRMLSMFRKK